MQSTQLMQRALILSEKGYGLTYPNPIVGAVITNPAGEIIGEGFHQRFTSVDHAEVVAMKNSTQPLKGSTIYVTLEPCNHVGTTPACTSAIIDSECARVVIATQDPHAIASGGIQTLRNAGIDVEVGLLAPDVEFSNRSWLHKINIGRPRMIWKLAISQDKKIAVGDGSPRWISSAESRADVQVLRSQSDAIVIGTGTALADNPHLIPRLEGLLRNPDRIVVGTREIPSSNKIFNDKAKTILIKSNEIEEIIQQISSHGYNQVLLECGPSLGNALLAAGYIDELVIYQSPEMLGRDGIDVLLDLDHELIKQVQIGVDTKSHYFVKKVVA
ncbi:MAG: bifunctional diaminohydroxyphosphoribosylaminopyrimidine deaminase/5-amino-6-(5-phosphoribosylamino)uracil reductase RibD [Candidatus Planktophila sp.]